MATGPDVIYVIRHGEKLGDPSDESEGGKHLSMRGSARAAALPSLFVAATPQLSCELTSAKAGYDARYAEQSVSGSAPRFSAPDFLFATKKSAQSNRPVETITPLAAALQLPINSGHEFPDAKYCDLAKLVLHDLTYAGKVVLICWHHGTIPDLAAKLGVTQQLSWKGKVFDRVWQIAYDTDPPTFTDQPQQLLFGDAQT